MKWSAGDLRYSIRSRPPSRGKTPEPIPLPLRASVCGVGGGFRASYRERRCLSRGKQIARKRRQIEFENLLEFQLRALKVEPWIREYRYAIKLHRQFRADFAWPSRRLLGEIQGGIWKKGGGGHSHPTGIIKDIERQQYAAILGFRVLPVTTDHVKSGIAAARIIAALGDRNDEQN